MFMKKDIPAFAEAGYRFGIEKSGRRKSATEHRNIAETRKGTKTNRAGPGKGNAFPRAEGHSPP
ncbi:acetyltransferase [Rhizobium phaseoli]|uniref:Acetyltransferase n=2 Tax=Rhizobium phaseoli TaxID=396 RepID=A0A7K3U880_9HYPH|nr:acetyltransferase [Rhizobium phaseoli]